MSLARTRRTVSGSKRKRKDKRKAEKETELNKFERESLCVWKLYVCDVICHNPRYDKDISRATISRWLCEVVRHAYDREGQGISGGLVRAFETRAWSASLAFTHNHRLQDVLNAAYWKSESTFINHYLRHVSRLRQDGCKGISSAVVAQQRISRH